jgi:hypothetical protein
MEHQSSLNYWKAKGAILALPLAAILMGSMWLLWACGSGDSTSTSEPWDGVAFVRRVTGGVEVATRPGAVEKKIDCGDGYLAAVTPDLRGYAVTSIVDVEDSEPTFQMFGVKRGSWPLVEVARVPFDPSDQPTRGAFKLIWLSADGNELLLLRDRTAEYVQIDGQAIRKMTVASDAVDISATDASIYILASDSPARVRWTRRPIDLKAPASETLLETDADGLYSGPTQGEVLLWSHLPELRDARGYFRLANLETGAIQDLPAPDGVVLRVVPMDGEHRAVTEWWDKPHELADGTMKTVFSLWDYSRGRYLRGVVNKEGWELQCTDPPCEAIPLRMVE